MFLVLVLISLASIALAMVCVFRLQSVQSKLQPVPENKVPGRGDEPVHLRTFGPGGAEQTWKQQQFLDEFEAQIAGMNLEKNSQELLKRAQGRYLNDDVQAMWELWAKAIALSYAKMRPQV